MTAFRRWIIPHWWKAPGALLALALVASGLATGCPSSMSLPADASPSVRYYAALQDYNLAKELAVAYVETPSTPASEAREVLGVVEEADAKVLAVATAVAAGGGDLTDTYLVASSALRVAADELRRIAAKGAAP